MAPLVTSADYDDLRALLDPEFTAADVPDALIELKDYLPAAEAEVARLLPDDDSDNAKQAVRLLAAAYLAPLFPVPESAQLDDFRYTIGKNATTLLYQNLIDRFRAAIYKAQVEAETALAPPAFIRVMRQSRYSSG